MVALFNKLLEYPNICKLFCLYYDITGFPYNSFKEYILNSDKIMQDIMLFGLEYNIGYTISNDIIIIYHNNKETKKDKFSNKEELLVRVAIYTFALINKIKG